MFSMRKLLAIGMFTFLTCIFCSSFCAAQAVSSEQRPVNSACERSDGPAKPYYAFDKIVLYFSQLPESDDIAKIADGTYFTKNVFEKHVMAVVQEAFRRCLKTESGEAKPIILIQGHELRSMHNIMTDPHNLVFVVGLKYPATDFFFPSAPDHAILTVSTYRAESVEIEELYNVLRTKAFTLFPGKAASSTPLSNQLDSALRLAMRPTYLADQ